MSARADQHYRYRYNSTHVGGDGGDDDHHHRLAFMAGGGKSSGSVDGVGADAEVLRVCGLLASARSGDGSTRSGNSKLYVAAPANYALRVIDISHAR